MLFFSQRNVKNFASWVYFCFYPAFHWHYTVFLTQIISRLQKNADAKVVLSISCCQKWNLRRHLGSCTNTYHDIKNLVKYMVKNKKTSVSWEQNITFLSNKKILNLCLRWPKNCIFPNIQLKGKQITSIQKLVWPYK